MFSFSQLNEAQILVFGLILLRMSSFVVSSAIFGAQNISAPLKILFSVVLTIVVFQNVATNEVLVRVNEAQNNLILLAVREAALGLMFGFVTRFFFFTIAMAGEIVSLALGLGQAQVMNPMMGSMGNAMEQFYTVIATLVFLALNGHHLMITGIADSFNFAPLAVMSFKTASFAEIVLKMQSLLVIALKISAPLMISMMVIQFGMALLSRVVPQINVLATSASITSFAGFIILFISLPLLVMQMTGIISFSMNEFFQFIRTF